MTIPLNEAKKLIKDRVGTVPGVRGVGIGTKINIYVINRETIKTLPIVDGEIDNIPVEIIITHDIQSQSALNF